MAALHSPSRAGFNRVTGRRTDTWRMTPYLRSIPGAAFIGRAMRASFYGAGERLNRHTATGEVFNPRAMTAAHRTLPMGTRLQVCYRGCVVVRINDRGPAAWTGKALDLTAGAARAIGHPGDAYVQAAVVR
ncbi:septal ring lytic transglycosylase RlpA family lipoprotein [Methylocystis hirsuta]|uniref:Septal ring lytic transglycosylase RlpA family lipoprotein n=2 Tax=Methylocystis hirsuta TaxID=369798 RepID=A0A3M9XUD2_9HYPH|nr:septal ring lytic transglycosylase RlpA family lipoprotein [Methylocystis hirsuta]